MAKGNQKYERQGIEKEQARSQAEYDSFLNQFLGRSQAASATTTPKTGIAGMLGQRAGLGGTPVGTAGPRPGETDPTKSTRYQDIIKSGADERDYINKGYRGFAETGGFSPEDVEGIRSSYRNALGPAAQANLSDFGEERGYYRNFADTGGYTDKDIQRTRAQAASSAPRLYDALKGQQALAASRVGANAGAGAGFDFKNARAAAQQSAQDKLGANIGLAESQRAGKQFGISGLESTQTTMDSGKLANAELLGRHNLASADLTSRGEQQIAEMTQRGKLAGLGGLQDLYGQSYAPEDKFNQTWMDAVGASGKLTQGNRGLQLQNDEVNRSRLAENIIGGIGAAAGGLTGMGAIGGAIGGITKGLSGGTPKLPMGNANPMQYMQGGFNPMMQAPPLNNTGMFGQNAAGYNQNIGLPPTNFSPGYNPNDPRAMRGYNFGGW